MDVSSVSEGKCMEMGHYKPYGFFFKDFVLKLIYVEKIELFL
jgi:hypothetical protein